MAKKSFLNISDENELDNPAMAFISEESIQEKEKKTQDAEIKVNDINLETPPKGYKKNPLYVETKSKRVQLILQPSLHKKIKIASKKVGLSLNEYAHRVFEAATKDI